MDTKDIRFCKAVLGFWQAGHRICRLVLRDLMAGRGSRGESRTRWGSNRSTGFRVPPIDLFFYSVSLLCFFSSPFIPLMPSSTSTHHRHRAVCGHMFFFSFARPPTPPLLPHSPPGPGPVVPAAQEAEAGGSLEPWRSGLWRAMPVGCPHWVWHQCGVTSREQGTTRLPKEGWASPGRKRSRSKLPCWWAYQVSVRGWPIWRSCSNRAKETGRE